MRQSLRGKRADALRRLGMQGLVGVAAVVAAASGLVAFPTMASGTPSPAACSRPLFADGGQTYFQVVSTCTWQVPADIASVDITIVGGGGGGGGAASDGTGGGGGGGGGEKKALTASVTAGTSYLLTVGAKGTGGAVGFDGQDATDTSVGGLLTARGGKGGKAGLTNLGGAGGDSGDNSGGAGSSGGGGGGAGSLGSGAAGTGTAGGDGDASDSFPTGNPVSGGGGGGGVNNNGGVGGDGGNGGGSSLAAVGGQPAANFRGSGGGGGGVVAGTNGAGGDGASGRILVKYATLLTPYSQTVSGNVGTPITPTTALTNGVIDSVRTYALDPSSPPLPAGLTLNATTGVLSGSPTSAQAAVTVVVRATDQYGDWGTAQITVTVVGSGGGGSGGGGSSGGTGGGGSAPEPEPSQSASPSPSASASPSVAPSAPARLEPVAPGSNPFIPTGGLPAGGSVFLVNGQPVPLQVSPNAPQDPVALVFSAPGLNMRLEGRGDADDPLGLSGKQTLILQSQPGSSATTAGSAVTGRSLQMARKGKVQPVARTSGDGFAAKSPVKLYLLTVGYLGEVITDDSGAFDGSVPIPAGLTPGVYTLQANGFAPDFSVRSLSVGVLVKPTVTRTATARGTVFFDVLSPVLSDAAKTQLRRIAAKARSGAGVVKSVVVGYVQPTNNASNDQSLSTDRARAVASYLQSQGVKGVFSVRGDGRAKEVGAKARRVNISVTYELK